MKKFLVVLLVIFVLAGIGGTGYFYYQYLQSSKEKNMLVQQNGELQSAIDAIGPVSNVYTVRADVFAGKELTEDDLVEQTIPVSSINENYVTDKAEIVGLYCKVSMKPGTSITKDVLMDDPVDATVYERDLTFDFLPLGLRIGDYVDIRIVLPYGEEFVVIQHERVEQYVLETNTVKLKLTEAQLALWTSALTDYSIWKTKGLFLYITKYDEPGISTPALPFYPVRSEMENVVTLNPNIKNKKECINKSLRKEIDSKLAGVTDEDGSSVSAGRSSEAGSINSAKETYYPGSDPNNPNNSTGSGSSTTSKNPDPTIQDEIDSLEGLENEPNDADDVVLPPVDSEGNSSTVTQPEVDNADGEDLYGDEGIIE